MNIDETNVASSADNLHEILDREFATAIHVRVMQRIEAAWSERGHGAPLARLINPLDSWAVKRNACCVP